MMVTDYFELFGFPLHIDVPAGPLRRKYYELSRDHHPDMETGEGEDFLSSGLSTMINEGYKTLADQDLRIQHILQLHGHTSDEKYTLPQSFLMEMLELNESIMESADDDQGKQQVMASVNAMEEELAALLTRVNQPVDNRYAESDIELIKEYFYKRRYLLRILKNMNTFASQSDGLEDLL